MDIPDRLLLGCSFRGVGVHQAGAFEAPGSSPGRELEDQRGFTQFLERLQIRPPRTLATLARNRPKTNNGRQNAGRNPPSQPLPVRLATAPEQPRKRPEKHGHMSPTSFKRNRFSQKTMHHFNKPHDLFTLSHPSPSVSVSPHASCHLSLPTRLRSPWPTRPIPLAQRRRRTRNWRSAARRGDGARCGAGCNRH